jgi:hypothetical protein
VRYLGESSLSIGKCRLYRAMPMALNQAQASWAAEESNP